MLLEDRLINGSLQQIVAGFTRDPVLQQDLIQECLIHVWRLESQEPGHTRSWYLQSCRFRLQHWMASGRSVDSPKRDSVAKRIAINGDEDEPPLEEYHTNGELFEAVSFQDVVSTLGRHLKTRERQVLAGLADGRVLREIASELRLSYPTALKCRRIIATMVAKLGISAMPGSISRPSANSHRQSPGSKGDKLKREKSQNHRDG